MTTPEATATEPGAKEMTGLQLWLSRAKLALLRWRRRHLPYLVWFHDEVDVVVTLLEDKMNPDDPLHSLFSGGFRDIEDQMRQMGIGFDTGISAAGRDWEWDWSLSGPISVRFKSRAKSPEKRLERPRPRLVVSNTESAPR